MSMRFIFNTRKNVGSILQVLCFILPKEEYPQTRNLGVDRRSCMKDDKMGCVICSAQCKVRM